MKNFLLNSFLNFIFIFLAFTSFGQGQYFGEQHVIIGTEASWRGDVFMSYDLNDDHVLDFFGSNDFNPVLYLSDNGSYKVQLFSAFNHALPVAFKDITNDGSVDILTASNQYYSNNGDGTFTGKYLNFGSTSEYFKAYEDFDNDGYIDIVSVKSPAVGNDNLIVYFKDNNNFVPVVLDKTMKEYGYLRIFDFNKDGKSDILLLNNDYSKKNFMVFINKGDRSFTKLEYNISSDIAIYSACFDVLDYDNDGDYDITVQDNAFFVMENTGTQLVKHQLTENISFDIVFYRFFDFDYDGDEDIIYIKNNVAEKILKLYYILNQGDFKYESPVLMGSATGYSSLGYTNGNAFENWFMINDANNDNSEDVILNGAGDKLIFWFENLKDRSSISITAQPQSLELCEGENAEFNVSGTGIISYQWQKNNENLIGDTLEVLSLSGVLNSDEGEYRCIVSGESSTDTSDIATLVVLEKVNITKQPESLNLKIGENAGFRVENSGDVDSYQWYKDEEVLTNSTKYTGVNTYELKIININETDKGSYHCVITGPCGSVTSDDVTLNVTSAVQDDLSEKIRVFPNPATDILNIEMSDFSVSELELKDNLGRIVKSIKNSEQMNISNIQPGLYFLTVITKETKIVKKIIIAR